jgi:hypothetical protein
MSTLKINTLSNLAGNQSTAVENAINGSAKAWVNFNGTGTVAIRASYNVSSITDNGTGDYVVNFATAMPSANYSIVGTGSDHGAWGSVFHTAGNTGGGGTDPTTTNCRVLLSHNGTSGRVDDGFVNVSVFR